MPDQNLPEPPNPSGLCQCGCGQKTSIAPTTIRAYGHLRGHPVRFIRGHAHRPGAERRFWEKVAKAGPDACWEWGGLCNRAGYGLSNDRLAHRRAYEFVTGPIPAGLHVLHTCDNPPCCNPAHLFLGTNADNIADRMAKGRRGGGPRKLSENDVLAIRQRYASGTGQSVLAADFGVCQATISKIVRRQRWKHI